MNDEDKKKYLSLYLIQNAKIKRLGEMMLLNPGKQNEYISEIKRSESLRSEIERKIQAVDGGVLSELLFLKYVCGKPLLEISCYINYSPRHTERLHKKALKKFRI